MMAARPHVDVQARCWQTQSGKICSEMAFNGILPPIPQIPRVPLTLSNDSFYSHTFEYGFPPPASDDDLPRERERARETRERRENEGRFLFSLNGCRVETL